MKHLQTRIQLFTNSVLPKGYDCAYEINGTPTGPKPGVL